MIKIINLTVTGTCITKHEQSHVWPSPDSNHSIRKYLYHVHIITLKHHSPFCVSP